MNNNLNSAKEVGKACKIIGVNIMKNKNECKSTKEILDELSMKWQKLNQEEKNIVISAITE